MALLRNISFSVVAALVGSVPYYALCGFAFVGPASEGGAPAQGALTFAALVAIGAFLACVFLVLARASWPTRDAVVRQHLFGWPIGIAALLFLVVAIPTGAGGILSFLTALLSCFVCGVIGFGGAALWLKLSYAEPA